MTNFSLKLAFLSVLLCSGCVDSGSWKFHRDGSYGPWWWRKSAPAYPPEVSKEPCIWIEGGKAWLIDQNGVHELTDN